ncbi:hypothetical protein DRO69_05295 [Candidatus Bathyarchaeota archaeon]|nr:MAG: hypothetical protein DRO69_05295 [Candidatus Bathyarchaeota archaeon]
MGFSEYREKGICAILNCLRHTILDLDKRGRIIGIEILDASKKLGKELVNKILNTEKLAVAA